MPNRQLQTSTTPIFPDQNPPGPFGVPAGRAVLDVPNGTASEDLGHEKNATGAMPAAFVYTPPEAWDGNRSGE